MLLNYAILVVACLYLLSRFCPCLCSSLHHIMHTAISGTRRSVEPPVPPPKPAAVASRVAKDFDTLIRTEASLINSAAFKHVSTVPFYGPEKTDDWYELHEPPHTEFFNFTMHQVSESADEFHNAHGERPNLLFAFNEHGNLNGLLYSGKPVVHTDGF
jgi:hypothetical protein